MAGTKYPVIVYEECEGLHVKVPVKDIDPKTWDQIRTNYVQCFDLRRNEKMLDMNVLNTIKPGFVVITRDGTKYLAMEDHINRISLANENRVIDRIEQCYNEEGNYVTVDERNPEDIMEIYDRPSEISCLNEGFLTPAGSVWSPRYRKLIWKRPEEVKEMTIAEIEKKLGCRIKVVKE